MMASGAPIHQLTSWNASLPVSAVHAEPHADREHNKEPRRDERKHELGYMKSM